MKTEETPLHLRELEKITTKYYSLEVDHSRYADIAFLLLKVSDGDKEAAKEVADFIQGQYAREKRLCDDLKNMIEQVKRWIMWAANWTRQKSEGEK